MYRVYFNHQNGEYFNNIRDLIAYLNPCYKLWVRAKSIGVVGNINGGDMPMFSYTGNGEEQYLREYKYLLNLCQQYGIFNIEELKKGGRK